MIRTDVHNAPVCLENQERYVRTETEMGDIHTERMATHSQADRKRDDMYEE